MRKIPRDKFLHIIISFSLIVLLYFLTSSISTSIIFTVLIGIGKEVVWDYILQKGSFELFDIYADVYGILLAVIWIIILFE